MQPFYLFYLVYCVYVGEGGGERANTRTEDTAGKGGGGDTHENTHMAGGAYIMTFHAERS